jgi:hypothetical protein
MEKMACFGDLGHPTAREARESLEVGENGLCNSNCQTSPACTKAE